MSSNKFHQQIKAFNTSVLKLVCNSNRYLFLVVAVMLVWMNYGHTNAEFYTEAVISDTTFTTGCWSEPTVPLLTSLPDDYIVLFDDPWVNNSLMTWDAATSDCPTAQLEYMFQVYSEETLIALVDDSDWQTETTYVTSANTNGEYYWRVTVRDVAHPSIAQTTSTTFHYTVTTSQVVLNEIMPDPNFDDASVTPFGEWIELYNKTDAPIDLAGWTITADAGNLNPITVSVQNAFTSFPFCTGTTVIPANGWLTVYRDGDPNFDLNNAGDTVRLFDQNDVQQDEHTYNAIRENKTLVRIPDGSSNWVDPVGTPGRANIVDESQLDPSVYIFQQDQHRSVIVLADGVNYSTATYTITYQREQDGQLVDEGLSGEVSIGENNTLYIQQLFMGSVSSFEDKVNEYPHSGIKNVQVKMVLRGEHMPERSISNQLQASWRE